MLKKSEFRTLFLLSTGTTTEYIAKALDVTPGRVHMIYCYLRDKTGIKDLFDKQQVRDYLESLKPSRAKRPTPTQLECMRLFVDDWSYEDIARKLRLVNPQTAQNHVSEGCKRLKIEQKYHQEYLSTFSISWRWRRRELIENYLKGLDCSPVYKEPEPPKDPMDDPCF